jgi:dUTPase
MSKRGAAKHIVNIGSVLFLLITIYFLFFSPNSALNKNKGVIEVQQETIEQDTTEYKREVTVIDDSIGQKSIEVMSPVINETEENISIEENKSIEELIVEPIIEEPDVIEANLTVLGFNYEVINETLLEVQGIKYKLHNKGKNLSDLQLYIYVYTDGSKGDIKEKVNIEDISYLEEVTPSIIVDALYEGTISDYIFVEIDLIHENETISSNKKGKTL